MRSINSENSTFRGDYSPASFNVLQLYGLNAQTRLTLCTRRKSLLMIHHRKTPLPCQNGNWENVKQPLAGQGREAKKPIHQLRLSLRALELVIPPVRFRAPL